MESSKALPRGHVLYEKWAAYWPDQGPDVEFSSFINGHPTSIDQIDHADESLARSTPQYQHGGEKWERYTYTNS
jgi:hypothetical protein